MTALIGSAVWRPGSELSVEGRRELLMVIDEESDRLNRFIEGLSAADRAEPASPIHLRTVNLDDVLRAGLMRAETVTRHHHVAVAVEEGVPPLSVDSAALTEVIYILLDNASKYAATGTAITVRAAVGPERQVQLDVTDEGPGIPLEFRDQVFEKFFRIPARASHDPRRVGVGLGLPIAKRLVEAQGGRIWIETPVSGRGTAIMMTLPASMETADADRPVRVAMAAK